MPLQLSISLPDQPLHEVVLTEGRTYLLGRGSECDVHLPDFRVSRRHARLEGSESGWRVVDLSSKNGLSVDGVPIGDALDLGSQAWLSLGGLLVRCRLVSAEEMTRSDAAVQDRWQHSMGHHARFDPAQGLGPLLEHLLRSILELSNAERAMVVLTRTGGRLEVAKVLGLEPSEIRRNHFAGSLGAVRRALETGQPVVLSDALEDSRLGNRPSIVQGGIRALLCLPLGVVDRVIGVVYADSQRPGTVFTDLDVEILSALASHAALAIAVARIHREVKGVREILDESPAGELAELWERTLPRSELTDPRYEPWLLEDSESGSGGSA